MQNETEGPEFFSQFTWAIFTHSFKKNPLTLPQRAYSLISFSFSLSYLNRTKKLLTLCFVLFTVLVKTYIVI